MFIYLYLNSAAECGGGEGHEANHVQAILAARNLMKFNINNL
jgi:hypothetical protein